MLSRLVVLAVTLVSTATVARLVPPSQYGLAVMAQVTLVFAQTFRDMGVTQAVLRKGHVTASELNLIFWLTVTSTTLLSAVMVAVSPAVAIFYREPLVTQLMIFAVLGFFVSGLTLQHRALLERDLRFGAVAVSDILGALLGFATAITMALIYGNAWAIVASSVVQAVTAGLMVVLFAKWRPRRPTRDPNLWDLIKFGVNSIVYSTSVLASNQAASVIIGNGMGPAALGQYNRAQMIYSMPAANLVQPFARATMPLLLRLRSNPEEYRLAYAALVQRLCVFLVPMSVGLTFVAVPLTFALLGAQWQSAGLVLTALAPSLAVMGLAFAVNDVLITQNRSDALRNLGLIEAVVRIGAVFIGSQFGLVQTAIAFTAATYVVTFVRVVIAGTAPPITVGDQLRAALPGLLTGVGTAVGCSVTVLAGVGTLPDWAEVLVQSCAGAVGALLAGLLWSRSRAAMKELAGILGLASAANVLARRPRAI